MQVSVAPGTAAVLLNNPAGSGTALCRWDAAELVTLTAAPASGQSRIDLVVLQVRDPALDAGSNNDFVFAVVTGTPATTGSQVAPAVPNNAYTICQVTVPGAAANLNTATLVDLRASLWGPVVPWLRVYRAAAWTPTNNGRVVFDTVGAGNAGASFAGGIFTCPVTGAYQVNSLVTAPATAVSQNGTTFIRRNGVNVSQGAAQVSTGASQILFVFALDVVPCVVGDQLDIIWAGTALGAGITGSSNIFMTVQYQHP